MAGVSAIILAAGPSSRLGRAKQLLSLGGKTLIRRAMEAAQAVCPRVIIVLGARGTEVRRGIGETGSTIVLNENWPKGMGSSVRKGIELLASAPDADAALLLTCDQPHVDAPHLRSLIRAWKQTGKKVVASSYGETIGVPALFDRACFDELLTLPDDAGAKAVILRDQTRVTSVPFPAGVVDIDTPADCAALNAPPPGAANVS